MSKLTAEALRGTILDVLASIAPELDPATLRPDAPLREQIDLDSFDYLNVLIALHKRLGVEVPEKDYAELQTLNGMMRYFGRRCGVAACRNRSHTAVGGQSTSRSSTSENRLLNKKG